MLPEGKNNHDMRKIEGEDLPRNLHNALKPGHLEIHLALHEMA